MVSQWRSEGGVEAVDVLVKKRIIDYSCCTPSWSAVNPAVRTSNVLDLSN